MSFFGKFKSGSSGSGLSSTSTGSKRDPHAPPLTSLEKLLADAKGSVRSDGSDKFFGFENYGSTCYCNSIIQCLYYSAPFRDHVINFPSTAFLDELQRHQPSATPPPRRMASTTPYPNVTSPARKQTTPASPGGIVRPEDQKDSPEYKKRQALSAGPVLDMTYDNSATYGMEESLFTSMRDIFEAIISHHSRLGVVSPHRFLEILRRDNEMFRSAMHQDAHEFLNLLLNQVVDNVDMFAKQHPALTNNIHMNGVATKESALSEKAVSPTDIRGPVAPLDTRWVHELFEGLLTSETRCLTCENTSQRDEAFLDLSVDLSPHTSVTSCLRKFSKEEMLCERNKFHCDNCGGLQEAEKRMKIKRLPRILALHLKRFKYTEDLQRLQKLFHRVVYPFHLRLFNTTDDAEDPDRLYELYAVVVHIGSGPYHGHYVSIIKTQDRGWLLFDDELVEPVDKSYVLNFFGGEPVPGVQDAKQLACAYVLFYQETTLDAVIHEQGMDGPQPSAAAQGTDVDASKDILTPPLRNDIRSDQPSPIISSPMPIVSPIPEEPSDLPTEPLYKAVTLPIVPADVIGAPESLQTTTVTPVVAPPKTKKELKQELKQEEKERKAAQKAEQKAAEDKRRDEAIKRIEARRKAEDELQHVLELSRNTAVEDLIKRGEDLPPPPKEGGLSLFSRYGSINRRGKPKLFGKEKEGMGATADLSATPAHSTPATAAMTAADIPTAERDSTEAKSSPELLAFPYPPPPPPGAVAAVQSQEEKTKKNRFSLGKKRSGIF